MFVSIIKCKSQIFSALAIKYSSKLDIFRSFVRIFAVNREYALHQLLNIVFLSSLQPCLPYKQFLSQL